MAFDRFALKHLTNNQICQAIDIHQQRIVKLKMNRCPVIFVMTVIILATLPYCSTLNLPSGDPAPGRSPGLPVIEPFDFKQDEIKKPRNSDDKLETNLEVPVEETVYDETTTNDEVTTVSDASVSERSVGDACAFARIPSDSDEIVTVSEADSDVNVTLSHPVFEADELVRGVVYEELKIDQGHNKDIFGERVDELFKTIVGDVYKVNHKHSISKLIPSNGKATKNNTNIEYDYDVLKNASLDEMKNASLIFDKYKRKHYERNIEELLKNKESPIPIFDSHEDQIGLMMRRFNNIQISINKTRRQNSPKLTPLSKHWKSFISISQQFVYATTYRLPYAQLLRKKYKDQIRYKIGYCFALLRHLKQQQMILYNAMKNNLIRVTTIYYHMAIYEKVVRLDVDIKDVIKFMKKLEAERRLKENVEDDEPIGNNSIPEWPLAGFPGAPGSQGSPGGPGFPGGPGAPGGAGSAAGHGIPGGPGYQGSPNTPKGFRSAQIRHPGGTINGGYPYVNGPWINRKRSRRLWSPDRKSLDWKLK